MFNTFYQGFYYSCLMLASVVAIALYKRLPKPFALLAALIVLTFANEASGKYLTSLRINKNFLYHIFAVVEFFMFTLIYKHWFKDARWNGRLLLLVFILLLAEVLNTIFLQPFSVQNTNIFILENLFLVFLSLCLFDKMRDSPADVNILTEGVFWANSAVFIFYTYNIVTSSLHNLKVYNSNIYISYYVNFILSGCLYLTFGVALMLSIRFYQPAKRLTN